MSFAGLLRHRVQLRRHVDTGNVDGRGQPITTEEAVGTYRTRIQQLSARELAILSQAGAVVGDHRLYFLVSTPVTTAMVAVPQPADGRLFEINRINDLGGEGRYLEAFATLVTSEQVPQS